MIRNIGCIGNIGRIGNIGCIGNISLDRVGIEGPGLERHGNKVGMDGNEMEMDGTSMTVRRDGELKILLSPSAVVNIGVTEVTRRGS